MPEILKTPFILREYEGKSYEEIETTLDRDHFMTAQEAKDFGIVDHVYDKRGDDK